MYTDTFIIWLIYHQNKILFKSKLETKSFGIPLDVDLECRTTISSPNNFDVCYSNLFLVATPLNNDLSSLVICHNTIMLLVKFININIHGLLYPQTFH